MKLYESSAQLSAIIAGSVEKGIVNKQNLENCGRNETTRRACTLRVVVASPPSVRGRDRVGVEGVNIKRSKSLAPDPHPNLPPEGEMGSPLTLTEPRIFRGRQQPIPYA